mmetsp:Transcript_44749/g.103512  ORF Transcript_44749/g.103512 Transcript_44749/m.103512 type:complete len:212 (-) Transcript_44749:9-644(-)
MFSTFSFCLSALTPISAATSPKRPATRPILPSSMSKSWSRCFMTSRALRSSSVMSRSLSPFAASRRLEFPNKVGFRPMSSAMLTWSSSPSKRACASSTSFLSCRSCKYLSSFTSALLRPMRFLCFLKMACNLVSDSLSSCNCCLTAWPFCIDSMQLPRLLIKAFRCAMFSLTSCKSSYIRTLMRVNSSLDSCAFIKCQAGGLWPYLICTTA